MRLPTPFCSICGHAIEQHKVLQVYNQPQWMVECVICLRKSETEDGKDSDRCIRKVNMERHRD